MTYEYRMCHKFKLHVVKRKRKQDMKNKWDRIRFDGMLSWPRPAIRVCPKQGEPPGIEVELDDE